MARGVVYVHDPCTCEAKYVPDLMGLGRQIQWAFDDGFEVPSEAARVNSAPLPPHSTYTARSWSVAPRSWPTPCEVLSRSVVAHWAQATFSLRNAPEVMKRADNWDPGQQRAIMRMCMIPWLFNDITPE